MTRLRALALSALAVALLAACSGTTRPAATVDGREISQQDVVDELEAIEVNDQFVSAFESGGTAVLGTADGTFDAAFVAVVLSQQIQFALLRNEVEARGLERDDACRQAARADLVDQLTGASTTGDGEAVFSAFPESYQGTLVDRFTDLLVLQGDLVGLPCVPDDIAEAYYDEHQDLFAVACARHILVGSEEEAAEIVALLEDGADFATLAAERGTDGTAAAGGELGCQSLAGYVRPFAEAAAAAEIGEVVGPVVTDFGAHVLIVDSREPAPSLDDIRLEVEQQAAREAEEAFSAWFSEAVDTAQVDVDPRYGQWNPEGARVDRNVDAPAPPGVGEGTGDPEEP